MEKTIAILKAPQETDGLCFGNDAGFCCCGCTNTAFYTPCSGAFCRAADHGRFRYFHTGLYWCNAVSGIDRIVPVGKTMDFSLVWDGRDLINELSRVVVV